MTWAQNIDQRVSLGRKRGSTHMVHIYIYIYTYIYIYMDVLQPISIYDDIHVYIYIYMSNGCILFFRGDPLLVEGKPTGTHQFWGFPIISFPQLLVWTWFLDVSTTRTRSSKPTKSRPIPAQRKVA